MPMQIVAFTSVRTLAASACSVVKPGSSRPASTAFSSTRLIRSAGRFFTAASLRITASAIFREPRLVADEADALPYGGSLTLCRTVRPARHHDAEDGTSTPILLARSRHASVRSLERYARPGVDAVARHVAERDPAARRRT
jgi:hypothetical protein